MDDPLKVCDEAEWLNECCPECGCDGQQHQELTELKRIIEHAIRYLHQEPDQPIEWTAAEELLMSGIKGADARENNLTTKLTALRNTLQFYADPDTWEDHGYENGLHWVAQHAIYEDHGDKARTTLNNDQPL